MSGVKQIGYATFETPDVARAVAYYTQYLGLTEVQRDGKTVFLACPSDFYSVVLKEGTAAAVTRLALQNAASVASLLLTTEAMVAEAPKDEAPAGGGMPDMGGMGGMGGMGM